MSAETIHITISRTQKGTPWEQTLVTEYDIEAERADAIKAVAQEIIKQDPSPYANGLYLRAVNEDDEVESFLLVPTYEDGVRTFYVRAGNYYNKWDDSYYDSSEQKRYLVCLDEETNDYKSYTMYQEAGNDKFGVNYGRIGGTDLLNSSMYNFDKEGSHFYPSKMFWIKYYEKMMKGYIDKTDEMDIEYLRDGDTVRTVDRSEMTELRDFSPIEEAETRDFIEFLISRQREYVQQNYYWGGNSVNATLNEKAVAHSEELLDKMSALAMKISETPSPILIDMFRGEYKELLTTLPRKIGNVKEYINRVDFTDEDSENYVDKVLENERDLLGAFKDVQKAEEILAEPTKVQQTNILEHFGLDARTADFERKFDVLEKMGNKAYQVSRVLAVTNNRTEKAYNACKERLGIEDRGCHLLWHGSRTENWWSIFKNGLSLNPNAVITGKMFGQGLYFAPKAEKSMGYIDMSGSYWAHGTQRTGYLALFEVAMGKPYETQSATGSRFSLNDLKHGCHSVWAKAGTQLYNDECIVYREDQCTIRYLVEVDGSRKRELHFEVAQARKFNFTNVAYDAENATLVANIPNFATCTAFPTKGVSVEYDIERDKVTVSPHALNKELGGADKELIMDLFKSKFAPNNREFTAIVDDIREQNKIPDDIAKRFKKTPNKKAEIER